MSSVDNRVVQMHFDNAQFEQGVAQTIQSLKSLDSALVLKNTNAGLGELGKALENVNVNPVAKGFQSLKGVAGGALEGIISLASTAANTVKILGIGLAGAATAQMVHGGFTRAANIEQAKFQLEGLGVAWSDISSSIDYAVKGTAYGLDEAALAASNFVASGVALGDDMSTALRGISGVAAMTSRSYSDIAHTFTRVAANGRAYAIDLQSFAAAGLNASAALARYLREVQGQSEITEQTVQDMVSRGEIDFHTFAAAMDWAFGAHAKEANRTFNGAFANMRAALSRIGADFAAPIRELGRHTFLGVTSIVDNIRAGLNEVGRIAHRPGSNPLYRISEDLSGSIVSTFEEDMGHLGEAIEGALSKFAKSDVLKNFIASFLMPIDAIWHGTWVNGMAIIESTMTALSSIKIPKTLTDGLFEIGAAMYVFGDWSAKQMPIIIFSIRKLFEIFANLARAIGTVISPILEAFFEVFLDGMGSLGDGIESGIRGVYDFLQRLGNLTEGLGLTEEVMAKIKETASSFFHVLQNIGSKVIDAVGAAFNSLGKVGRSLWPVLEAIGELLGGALISGISILADVLSIVIDKTVEIGSAIGSLLSGLVNFEGVLDFFKGFSGEIKNLVKGISFDDFVNGIKSFAESFLDLEKGGDLLKGVWEKIGDIFKDLLKNASGLFEAIGKGVSDSTKKVGEFGGTLESAVGSKITGFFEDSSNGLSAVADGVSTVFSPITNLFNSIKDAVDSISLESLVTPLSMLFSGVMLGSVAKFAMDMAKIPSAITGVADAISDLISLPTKALETVGEFAKALQWRAASEGIRNFAIAVGALAVSMYLISKIDSDKMVASVAGIAAIVAIIAAAMAGMVVAIRYFTKFATVIQAGETVINAKAMASMAAQLGALAGVFLSLAVSVGILAVAAYALSKVGPDIWLGVGAIAALVAILGAVGILAGRFVKTNLAGFGIGLMLFVTALLGLVGVIALLGTIPFDLLTNGILRLAGLLAILGVAVALLASGLSNTTVNFMAVAGGLAIMAAALYGITGVIAILGAMDSAQVDSGLGSLARMVLIITGSMLLLGSLGPKAYASLLSGAAGILSMALAIGAITASLSILAGIAGAGGEIESAVDALVHVISILTLSLVLISKTDFMGSAVRAGVAFAAMSLGLISIASAITILTLAPLDKLSVVIGLLSALMLAISLVGIVATYGAPGLSALAVVLLAFGGAALMVSASIGLFALGLMLLAAIAPTAAEAIGQAMDIMAQHVEKSGPKLAKGIGDSIGAFAEAIANKKEAVAVASATLVSGFLMGLASMLGEIVAFGMRVTIAIARGIADNIAPLAQAALDIISGLIMGLAAGVGNLISAAFWLMTMFITGLAEAVNVQGPLLYNAVSALMSSIFALIEDMLADLVEGIPIKGHEWAEAIRGRAAELRQASAEATAGIHEQFDEAFQDSQASAESGMSTVSTTISSATGSIAGAAGQVGAAAGVSLQASMGNMAAGVDMDAVMEAIASGADPAAISAMMVGTTADQGLQEGMSTMPDNAAASTQAAVDAAASVDAYGPASGLGSDFGSGFMGGIDSMIAPVASKAADMVRAAKEAAQSEQNSSSPSKDAMKYGKWFGQGYEIGLAGMIGRVADTAAELVGGAKGTVVDSMRNTAKLLDGIDWDANPVITPVLDTSLLQQGMSELPGFFNNQFMAQAAWAQFAATGMANPWRAAEPISSTTVGDTYTIYIDGQMLSDSEELRSSVLTFMGGLRRIGGMNLG